METIVISSDRIKIMLTEKDMEAYHLNAEELSSGEGITGKLLRRILRDAQGTVDFDSAKGRLHVQIYSSDKGCEMFVTRLEGNDDEEKAQTFRFESLADAAMLCRRMSSDGHDASITVYHLGGTVFASFGIDAPAYACDYGSAVCENDLAYIREYRDDFVMTSVTELSSLT